MHGWSHDRPHQDGDHGFAPLKGQPFEERRDEDSAAPENEGGPPVEDPSGQSLDVALVEFPTLDQLLERFDADGFRFVWDHATFPCLNAGAAGAPASATAGYGQGYLRPS